MVLLLVKGTKYPDEFVVERRLTDIVAGDSADTNDGGECKDKCTSSSGNTAGGGSGSGGGGLAKELCHIQNSRHRLRLMLLSSQELSSFLQGKSLTDAERTALSAFMRLIEELTTTLKDKTTPVQDQHQFDRAADAIRQLTVELYPEYCTVKADHKSSGEGSGGGGAAVSEREAVIDALNAMYEDPNLGEDERLTVYHCRAILDPHWKAEEDVREEEAGLWFCGKLMASGPLSNYCGRNERSKVTVKVSPRTGTAPSGEPRMRYEDQRALYEHMRQRKEAYRQLEESELRDRVVRQSRGQVVMPSSAFAAGRGGEGSPEIAMSQLRPVYPRREERIVSE